MFGFLTNPRTYMRYLYLFLSFPLGLLYFIGLILGISLGTGLAIIGIGILILAATAGGVAAAAAFERRLSNLLLGTSIPPVRYVPPPGSGFMDQVKMFVADGRIIRDGVYIFLRFPFGIGALIMFVLTLLPVALILSPFLYSLEGTTIVFGPDEITTMGEALMASVAGFVLLPIMVYANHLMLQVWATFTAAMLGGGEHEDEFYEKSKRHTVTVPTGKTKRDDFVPYEGGNLDDSFVSDFEDDLQPRRTLAELVGEVIDEQKAE